LGDPKANSYKLNLRENKNWGKKGECGSPVIDLEGEVTGVFVGHITLIKDVLEAIDNLE